MLTTLVQLLLVSVICTLTVLTVVAGIQVFHILHEFRQTLKRLNLILDNTRTISDSAAKPISAVNEFFSEVKGLVNETQDQIVDSTPDRVITPAQPSVAKRFFHRAGLSLRAS